MTSQSPKDDIKDIAEEYASNMRSLAQGPKDDIAGLVTWLKRATEHPWQTEEATTRLRQAATALEEQQCDLDYFRAVVKKYEQEYTKLKNILDKS